MALLSCEHVSVSYDTSTAVDNVSFSIDEGDYLFVLGENGAGKSTLMRALLGLLPTSSGRIQYSGVAANEIGYLPQQTVVQKDFPASVSEVVLSGCLNQTGFLPFYSVQNKKQANRAMEQLGITHLKKRCYRELSGGQQQRVLLARALCATRKLLILDEPVAGLDPMVTNEMYALIEKLNQEHGLTIIMISHDVHNAVAYGNKILQLSQKVLFFGSAKEYEESPIGQSMIGGLGGC